MPTRARTVAAVAVAAAVTAGSAMTGSNTFAGGAASPLAGYGEVSTSGAEIVGISFTPWESDGSRLGSVSFTTTTNITGRSASLTLKNNGEAVSSYPCSAPGPYESGLQTVVCSVSAHDLVSSFDTTGFTVY